MMNEILKSYYRLLLTISCWYSAYLAKTYQTAAVLFDVLKRINSQDLDPQVIPMVMRNTRLNLFSELRHLLPVSVNRPS